MQAHETERKQFEAPKTQEQTYNPFAKPPVHAVDASLEGQNIIIAKRRIIKVDLVQCLAVDVVISAFHIHLAKKLMIMATSKVIYLWDLEYLNMLQKYGRENGGIHRENILDCKFDSRGTYFASAGEDKRVVIWSSQAVKSEKILDGHQGKVFEVQFSSDDENIISCSDDGRVIVWEWRTDRPDKIVCGRNDGAVSIWDLNVRGIVDTIIPDPDWIQDGEDQSLVGWYGIQKHHSGAIMAIAISPNGKYMATCATDHTTKLWSVVSFMKEVDGVQAELMDASQKARQLDQYINVFDDKYDAQIKLGEFTGLKIGEVPIPTGYHSDLMFTFRHDSTVLCVAFNHTSDICFTGSMDSTCRLWSCRRGDMLFQINMPAPVASVYMSLNSNDMFA
ncbi:hypothetical protein HK100_007325, partial [Physocladia obscura]